MWLEPTECGNAIFLSDLQTGSGAENMLCPSKYPHDRVLGIYIYVWNRVYAYHYHMR
jgi:hypothetical protein